MSSGMINYVAFRFQEKMNNKSPNNRGRHLGFSNGWLQKYQLRWNICLINSHGDSGDVKLGVKESSLIEI